MENNTQDTFISMKWDRYSLVVIKNWCFWDIVRNTCCKPTDVELLDLQNELWKECLKELRRNNCDYIIAWYNDQEVIVFNKASRLHTYWKKRFRAWYTYRIKRPNNYVVAGVDIYTRNYYRMTVMPRIKLYDLIVEANNNWYILENEVTLRKHYAQNPNSKWTWLNRQQKTIMKQLKMYTQRVAELAAKDTRDKYENNELAMYSQKFNIRKAVEINKVLKNWEKEKMNIILSFVRTSKTYYDVINNFD